ncbi:MAG: hypothetical protein RR614_13875, partial [Eubacterium sp.]
MDTKRPDNRDLQELLEKKKDLLSLFSSFEDRIDHKISHLTDSTEGSPEHHGETSDKNTAVKEPEDDLFEQAVRKSQKTQVKDGIIGYHTEEILGIDAALAALDNDTSEAKEAETKIEAVTPEEITTPDPPTAENNPPETTGDTEQVDGPELAFIAEPSTEEEAAEIIISDSIETISSEDIKTPVEV